MHGEIAAPLAFAWPANRRNFASIMDNRLPDDIFERPGHHCMYEVGDARVADFRNALEALRQLGVSEPLERILGYEPGTLEPFAISPRKACAVPNAVDIGLNRYGSLLAIAECDLGRGEPLVPYLDQRETPIFWWWDMHRQDFFEFVAKASDTLAALAKLEPLPERFSTLVERELIRHDIKKREARALVTRWRDACADELARLQVDLAAIANRGGWVMTWYDGEGL